MTRPLYGQRRQVTRHAAVVLAGNPSGMTLEGTNTWVLGIRPGRSIVVDPGPEDDAHLDAVLAAAGHVEHIVLTHHHEDHRGNLLPLAYRTGADVSAADPQYGEQVDDGDVIEAAGVRLTVVRTPGHTADSLCLVTDDGAVLTGDTVLGRGTTVIASPDGDLGDYLDSLRRLIGFGPVPVLPGHGPELEDLSAVARRYLDHRLERLDQVRTALDELGLSPDPAHAHAVVERVYADVERSLWWAAEQSVTAQLAYLGRQTGTP